MKITFILEAFKRGGKERRCLQLIQGLNRQGYNYIQLIIINNGIEYQEIYDTTAQIKVLDKKNLNLSSFNTYKLLKKYISEFDPDVVHAWGEVSMMYMSLLRLTRKFVYICANVADCNRPKWYSIRNIVSRISYAMADAVVGNSKQGLKAYSAPKHKSYCVYNGFNESRFKFVDDVDEVELKKSLGVNTPYLVAMFARVDYYKDYDSFITLAREVLKRRNDVMFLAVGGGLYYENYKNITLENESLKFIGFRSDVEKIMAITDVSILFSNYKFHKEGISNSILESMALGTPVIATNDGGSPEIISDNYNGFLVDENNITIASDILCELLDNPDKLRILSTNAENTVQQGFLLEHMINNYVQLYNKLLESKK